MKSKSFTLNLDWQDYTIEVGKLAQQTNWSCTIRAWDTMILATACMKRKPTTLDFFPLMVNYQEKHYAWWRITSSRFNKRENRPPDDKILIWRLIDRGLRPLFPKWFNHETQIMLTILAYDGINSHDTAAWIACSVAFCISDIPFLWPNVLVRVWLIDWNFILNPTIEQRSLSNLDLLVTCTKENIVMIEAWANQVDEQVMLDAMQFALDKWKKICEFIESIAAEIWREKMKFEEKVFNEKIFNELESWYTDKIHEIIFNENIWKLERFSSLDDLKDEAVIILWEKLNTWIENEEDKVSDGDIREVFWKLIKKTIRKSILKNEKRIKSRKLNEIRPLSCEVWLLPRVHWSGLFNRWETQWLSIVTLGWPWDRQLIEWVEWESEKKYFHHYNFPPYSVWETSNRLSTGNREIWHWALAEKALLPVLPNEEEFPYVVRVVTEILSSNWSSSMAAVCWSTLALMDAWVPIKSPVWWVAMWLMTDDDWNFKVLTDLQDEEDFWWDMDFKVAWTRAWITAIQMDIKLTGIPMDVFKIAFVQAKDGRMKILDAITWVLAEPRSQLSASAPSLITLKVELDDIKIIIWKWWETIQGLIKELWVKIDINDEWIVVITASSWEAWQEAKRRIEILTQKPEVWKIYQWKVMKIMEFWAFVEFLPKTEWLVHISELSEERVAKTEDVVKVWDAVMIKVLEKDKMWRYKLSMKAAK